jgi:hypothetical protein
MLPFYCVTSGVHSPYLDNTATYISFFYAYCYVRVDLVFVSLRVNSIQFHSLVTETAANNYRCTTGTVRMLLFSPFELHYKSCCQSTILADPSSNVFIRTEHSPFLTSQLLSLETRTDQDGVSLASTMTTSFEANQNTRTIKQSYTTHTYIA